MLLTGGKWPLFYEVPVKRSVDLRDRLLEKCIGERTGVPRRTCRPTPKQLLKNITRREFETSIIGGIIGAAASHLMPTPLAAAAGDDFTIAIVPDPQYLAEACPDNTGRYYTAMMQWIVDNRNILLTSSPPSFRANIKAVVGVGDCVNSAVDTEFKNAENAWRILDANGIAFTTPPGNHDYSGELWSRNGLGRQFKTGYFSAKNRSRVYGSGIDLGDADMAYWIGSHDSTGPTQR